MYKMKDPYSREKLRVLLSFDMSKLPADAPSRTDKDNPIAWIQQVGKGRVFYCSLGHNRHIFWDPQILQFYLDGIQYALGDLPADATPSAKAQACSGACVGTEQVGRLTSDSVLSFDVGCSMFRCSMFCREAVHRPPVRTPCIRRAPARSASSHSSYASYPSYRQWAWADDSRPGQNRPGIRHSDVVFMYDDAKMYEPYGCTVLGWAGHADREHIERAHAQGVRLFTVSVGFLTEFQGMIDFSDGLSGRGCAEFLRRAIRGSLAVGPQTQGTTGLVVVHEQSAVSAVSRKPPAAAHAYRSGRAAHRRLSRFVGGRHLAVRLLLPALPGRISHVPG